MRTLSFARFRRRAVSILFTGDEGFDLAFCDIIRELHRRGLLEVGAGGDQGAAESAVLADLGATNGIDHDASAVGAVPTSSFSSIFKGTSPNVVPSMRI